jgi:hypothetical protein
LGLGEGGKGLVSSWSGIRHGDSSLITNTRTVAFSVMWFGR